MIMTCPTTTPLSVATSDRLGKKSGRCAQLRNHLGLELAAECIRDQRIDHRNIVCTFGTNQKFSCGLGHCFLSYFQLRCLPSAIHSIA